MSSTMSTVLLSALEYFSSYGKSDEEKQHRLQGTIYKLHTYLIVAKTELSAPTSSLVASHPLVREATQTLYQAIDETEDFLVQDQRARFGEAGLLLVELKTAIKDKKRAETLVRMEARKQARRSKGANITEMKTDVREPEMHIQEQTDDGSMLQNSSFGLPTIVYIVMIAIVLSMLFNFI